MDRFTLTQSGNYVVVHVGEMHKSDADSSGWTGSVIQLSAEE
jgi:hydrogenase maturation factor